jgi:cyclic pyranopterin phosphate synthase
MKIHHYPYLRLSLTDRCNFNCFYCQPRQRRIFLDQDEILTHGEILSLVKVFSRYGVKHVRLTGGEPLLRDDFKVLIQELSNVSPLKCLSLTTNGYLLSDHMPLLKETRIEKINVSLDTLKRDRFMRLAGIDGFLRVMEGVLEAKKSGIKKVKLNVLLIRGFNDDEVFDFVDFAHGHELDVRFIEYFPTSSRSDVFESNFVPSKVVFEAIRERYGDLEFLGSDPLSGPAKYFRIKGQTGRIGFISSVTDFFCHECNRLRLTSDGKLYMCLHSDSFVDLKKPLRQGDFKSLFRLIEESLLEKRRYNKAECSRTFEMSSMGG